MQLFFSNHISGNDGLLSEDETRHCVSVLRKKEGDFIEVVDGNGYRYHCTITKITKQVCSFHIDEKIILQPLSPMRIHLAIAPTKNADRMEWLLEKAIEIGISEISFIHCEHSEKSRVNMERMHKIAVSALKQSGQPFLPILHDPEPFQQCIASIQTGTKLIAHCNMAFPRQPLHWHINALTHPHVMVLIGPEGDFSETEIRMAEQQGFAGISLGKSRLRTETAGLVAITLLNGLSETPSGN